MNKYLIDKLDELISFLDNKETELYLIKRQVEDLVIDIRHIKSKLMDYIISCEEVLKDEEKA